MKKGNENTSEMTKLMSNVYKDGNRIISYTTHVATIKGGDLLIHGHWSQTTSCHITKVAKMFDLTKVNAPREEEEEEGGSPLRAMGLVMAMGALFSSGEKERNDWDLRMAKASGLSIPDDWDGLPEEVKRDRLNKVREEALRP